jgi:hypoxanthine-guanine phosphoribosyltransferase
MLFDFMSGFFIKNYVCFIYFNTDFLSRFKLLISRCLNFFSIPGNAKDRHVVIVDDLVQTGGTLIECAKVG